MEDNKALEQLVIEVAEAESQLAIRKEQAAAKSAEVADIFKAEKELSANVEAIKILIKDEMRAEGITDWNGERATLTLRPSGKYRTAEGVDVNDVDDAVCEVKKTLVNSKVKAYLDLNGKLPEGVESSGDVLRIKWKEQ